MRERSQNETFAHSQWHCDRFERNERDWDERLASFVRNLLELCWNETLLCFCVLLCEKNNSLTQMDQSHTKTHCPMIYKSCLVGAQFDRNSSVEFWLCRESLGTRGVCLLFCTSNNIAINSQEAEMWSLAVLLWELAILWACLPT